MSAPLIERLRFASKYYRETVTARIAAERQYETAAARARAAKHDAKAQHGEWQKSRELRIATHEFFAAQKNLDAILDECDKFQE